MKSRLFTSESVTEGHPDKLCDLISDSILDEYLKQDSNSRVAIETFASANLVVIAGEVTSTGNVNVEKIARQCIKEVGYEDEGTAIDYRTCKVIVNIHRQSPDIAMGTNEQAGGAGDQGMMFGYASNETKEYMPTAIVLAHRLTEKLTEVRKNGILGYLKADGKSQVTIEYDGKAPKRVHTVVIATQHDKEVDIEELRKDIKEKVIKAVIPEELLDEDTIYYINATGRFVIGGPLGDTGLTGRKIIVDTYGGYIPHGGGAFSGKDPTKVDRSAAYMARHIAKNIVANDLASECQIELAYAIGVKQPVSISIDTFGTSKKSEQELIDIITKKFDLSPKGIINYLKLREPIYTKTTNYGHFGKKGLAWEDVVEL